MIKNKLSGLAAVVLAVILQSTPSKAQQNWMDINPGLNTTNNSATVKIEGNAKIPHGSLFGKLYLDAIDKRKLDFENYFTLITATYYLGQIFTRPKGLGAAAELNSGGNFSDTWRFGPSYERSFGKGNYTLIKFFPFNTGKDKEKQISTFLSQDVYSRLGFSALFNYNFRPNADTYYVHYMMISSSKI